MRSSASTCRRARSGPTAVVCRGTSVAVMTATTPGIAAAPVVSIERRRAEAYGERTTTPWSIPGIAQSPAYAVAAETLSRASWRITGRPISRYGRPSHGPPKPPLRSSRPGKAVALLELGSATLRLPRVDLQRIQDLGVAGTAAEIPFDGVS